MPRLSIVTGTYNRLVLLQDMMKSAHAGIPPGIPLEFVIVDGGSTDGTLDWCKSQADVMLIEHGELLGGIRAFCDGAKEATGKYVVLANDDIAFFPGALLRAILHLEETATCGAVAFADNRPVPPWYPDGSHYHVLSAPGQRNGKTASLPYAQVGMFRRWLGDAIGWWGADDKHFPARTYGGDNYLSSKIWELGYTVDKVDGCRVEDTVAEDELRQINRGHGGEKDSRAYYDYPDWLDKNGKHLGPVVPTKMGIDNLDKRNLRILYLPIFEMHQEGGLSVQQQQKRGLREALAKVGWVYELDYMNTPTEVLLSTLLDICATFRPDMLFTQLQSCNILTVEMLERVRMAYPGMLVANWNGDTHRANLITPAMMDMLRLIDLQLTVNHAVMQHYKQHGIACAYWQCSYEPVSGKADAPGYEVVFLGSGYNENRQDMARMLRDMLGIKFGLYGDFWDHAQGRTLYDYEFSNGLNRNARIAVGSNEFPQDYGFISNRIWETMAAGGCLFMMQHVPGLKELTGITAGKHYVEWTDLDDLRQKVGYYLENETERAKIAKAGARYVRKYHSFDARVTELFTDVLPLAKKRLDKVSVKYTGMMREQFGVKGRISGRHYLVEPMHILWIDPRDVTALLREGNFEMIEPLAVEGI